jgi:hypothetical protein
MPKYTPAAFGDGAVLVRQNPAHLAHTGSFLGLALDQSESMNTLAGVAIDSVNYLIEEQRSLNGNSRFSLLLFNNKVETIRDSVPLSEFPLLDESQYQPCGGTALNDAVAGLIRSIGAHAQGRRSSVLCVIITDGMENVSRCYRIEDVRQMVTYRRLTHGWQFLFLGPESALDYALSIGIPRSNFAGFKTTSEGLRQILDRLGRAVKAYAPGDRQFALKLHDKLK